MSFTQAEIDHLATHTLPRLGTVRADGQPDVVPVTVEFDGTGFWICGAGEVGMAGPGYYMRVTQTVSRSSSMAGEPAGDDWYPTGRAVHGGD